MHATARGGCTDTVRESALEADSGRKIPCVTGDSNPRQYCALLFSRTLYQQSYSLRSGFREELEDATLLTIVFFSNPCTNFYNLHTGARDIAPWFE